MKWSFAGLGIILLGIIGAAIMFLFINVTTGNENDYYLLKEVTEAAMYDAIDLSYYKENGEVKIVKEKFVENFTRRFVESNLFIGNEYAIDFYEVWEDPPKVTVVIRSTIKDYTVYQYTSDYSVVNNLTGILELKKHNGTAIDSKNDEVYKNKEIVLDYYSMTNVQTGTNQLRTFETIQTLNVPNELNVETIKKDTIKIELDSIEKTPLTQADVNRAWLLRDIRYKTDTSSWDAIYSQPDPAISIEHFYTSENGINDVSVCAINCNNWREDANNCDHLSSAIQLIKISKKCPKKEKESGEDYVISISGSVDSDFAKNFAMLKYNLKWTFQEDAGIDEVGDTAKAKS